MIIIVDMNNRYKIGSYRILCTKIFKTLNNLSPVFLKTIFHFRETERPIRNEYRLNLEMPKKRICMKMSDP